LIKKSIDLYRTGEHLQFNDARELTNGQRSEGILTLAPNGNGPPAHIHTRQTEGFEVIEGSLILIINGKERVLNTNESTIVKAGEPHTFKNASNAVKAVAKFWYEPALNIEWFTQTVGEDAMANGGAWERASVLPVLYAFYKMRSEYRLGAVPFWVQDFILTFFALIAKVTGAYKKFELPAEPG